LPHAVNEPAPEYKWIEVDIEQSDFVLFRVVQQHLFWEFPVLNGEVHDRESGEGDIVELVHDSVVDGRA